MSELIERVATAVAEGRYGDAAALAAKDDGFFARVTIIPGTGSGQRWRLNFFDRAGRHLGVSVVKADNIQTATDWAIMNGCHGFHGQVKGVRIADDVPIPDSFYDRLLSRDQIAELERLISSEP